MIIPIKADVFEPPLIHASQVGQRDGGIGDGAQFAQDRSEPIIISTSMATAASIHLATSEPIVVAFQDSNLRAVAKEFKAMYPYRSFSSPATTTSTMSPKG